LLVVITIIAILAGILLPALSAAREKARRIVCVKNEKQIGTWLNLYTDDHDDFLPPAKTAPGWRYWNLTLDTAMCNGVTDIWRCPQDTFERPDKTSPSRTYSINIFPASWGAYRTPFGSFTNVQIYQDVSIAAPRFQAVPEPTATVLLGEQPGAWIDGEYADTSGTIANGFHSFQNFQSCHLHADGGNYLYADLHVAYLGAAAIAGPDAEDSPWTW